MGTAGGTAGGSVELSVTVIPMWNSLSNHFVSADTINTFQDRSGLIKMYCMITRQISMVSGTVVL